MSYCSPPTTIRKMHRYLIYHWHHWIILFFFRNVSYCKPIFARIILIQSWSCQSISSSSFAFSISDVPLVLLILLPLSFTFPFLFLIPKWNLPAQHPRLRVFLLLFVSLLLLPPLPMPFFLLYRCSVSIYLFILFRVSDVPIVIPLPLSFAVPLLFLLPLTNLPNGHLRLRRSLPSSSSVQY